MLQTGLSIESIQDLTKEHSESSSGESCVQFLAASLWVIAGSGS